MLDQPTRALIAYGLIALMVLAAVGLAWWRAEHRRARRGQRSRLRRPRLRAATHAPTDSHPPDRRLH
jgi:hypothetical protein